MSGPSTMPLCQDASSCMSSIGWLLPVGMKWEFSGMDHRTVFKAGFM